MSGQAFDARSSGRESDLRESEERFQQLFNASPDGVVVIDSNGRIWDANWAQARMYGHDSPDDLIGVKATLLVAPSCRAYSAQIMQRRLNGEEIPPVEYELVRKDGSTFYGETLATTLRNPDGTVSGYICTTRDTTERRRAEAALRESEKRYRDLFDGAAEGIFRSSMEGKVLSNNEAMAQMLGYDSAGEVTTEVVDSARQIWADPDERSRFTKLVQEQGIVARLRVPVPSQGRQQSLGVAQHQIRPCVRRGTGVLRRLHRGHHETQANRRSPSTKRAELQADVRVRASCHQRHAWHGDLLRQPQLPRDVRILEPRRITGPPSNRTVRA